MRNKIESGDYSIDYEKDETLKKSKEAWDKYYENHKKTLDTEKELQSLEDSGHTKRVEQLKEQIETAKALGDASYISYGDADASLATNLKRLNLKFLKPKKNLMTIKNVGKKPRKISIMLLPKLKLIIESLLLVLKMELLTPKIMNGINCFAVH